MYDVIVVGAGPAGNAAAKRSAESGFRTLLLEKFALPRKKVCDSELNPRTLEIVQEEFGDIPDSILSNPPSIDGLVFNMPDPIPPAIYDFSLPWLWRSELDNWMSQKAIEKGVSLWEETRFLALERLDQGYKVRIERNGSEEEVEARFVIGADGCASTVRRCLFPDLKLRVFYQAQERFRDGTTLDKRFIHEFPFLELKGIKGHGGFDTYHKDDLCVISYLASEKGQLNSLKRQIHEFLAMNFGFNPDQEPVWTKGCTEPNFCGDLISGRYRPAKDNVLLTGDAAGFMPPASIEGIGPSVRTGQIAAEAISEAMEKDEEAENIYMQKLEPLLLLVREDIEYAKRLAKASEDRDFEASHELRRNIPFQDFYTKW